jgi:hypothetical protein
MSFATEFGVLTTIGKQSAFGAVATDGFIIPLAKGARGPKHERPKVENDARYQDGFNREWVQGNPESGAEMPHVPNLDYIGYPLLGFLGAFTDTVVGGLKVHTGGMTKNVLFYTIGEIYENLPSVEFQYLDQVYSEYNFELSNQGLFKPTFNSIGSGAFNPNATPFDSTPTEVAGSGPAEMINWATAVNGADEAVVSKLTVNCKREVLLAWVSTATGMKCVDMVIGSQMVSGTMTTLFKNDTMWARARNGTIFALDATITRVVGALTYSLAHTFPELKIRTTSPEKQTGQLVQQSFEFESFKGTSADAPMKVVLKNGTTTHA